MEEKLEYRRSNSGKLEFNETTAAEQLSAAELLASGFTPPRSIDDDTIVKLKAEKTQLQMKINGLLVLPTLMQEKSTECKEWKQRALEAESITEQLVQVLTPAQLDELRARGTQLPSKLLNYADLRMNCGDDGTVSECRREIEILKLQVATYAEDFNIERRDREHLAAECHQLKRQLEVLTTERDVAFRQVRQYEDEVFALRDDNSTLKLRLRQLPRVNAADAFPTGSWTTSPLPLVSSDKTTPPRFNQHPPLVTSSSCLTSAQPWQAPSEPLLPSKTTKRSTLVPDIEDG